MQEVKGPDFVPTLFTHAAIGFSAATALSEKPLPGRFWPLAVSD
jgi:hypothetical protein